MELLAKNSELLEILTIIRSLKLNDCWLCAGTISNYIWNYLAAKETDHTNDVDVVFFDPMISYEETLTIEKNLKRCRPDFSWEVKNECYMHIHSPNTKAYTSSRDAIAKFPEKCTAIGARLNDANEIELFVPYGIEDIINFRVAPTPHFANDPLRMALFKQRVAKKTGKVNGQQSKSID